MNRRPATHDECAQDLSDRYFSDHRFDRKTAQLCSAIERVLMNALTCDVDDPLLDGLHLHEVRADAGGTYTALFATADVARLDLAQARLREVAHVFRAALAVELTRKRVPTLALYVVPDVRPAYDEVDARDERTDDDDGTEGGRR